MHRSVSHNTQSCRFPDGTVRFLQGACPLAGTAVWHPPVGGRRPLKGRRHGAPRSQGHGAATATGGFDTRGQPQHDRARLHARGCGRVRRRSPRRVVGHPPTRGLPRPLPARARGRAGCRRVPARVAPPSSAGGDRRAPAAAASVAPTAHGGAFRRRVDTLEGSRPALPPPAPSEPFHRPQLSSENSAY